LLLALALAACSRTPRVAPLAPTDTVLAFGDSLTFGTGAAPDESYPAQLAARIGRKVVNAGVPGEISADGLKRLPAALEEHRPKLLILCHGGNDFLRRLGDEAAADNVRAMIRLAQAKNIAVVLMATPKPGLAPSAAGFYADIAREFDLPLENEVIAEVLGDSGLKSDPVHPNARGYAKMADALAALLKKAKAL
jgi:lysophospholipase L1-like esterase